MRIRALVLAAALILAPPGAQAADLVVWWEKGYNPQEDAAVAEIIAAFEQNTGKQVELVLPSQDDMEAKLLAAVEAGQPPDFLFGTNTRLLLRQWAYDGRLVDLSDVVGPFQACSIRTRSATPPCSTRPPADAPSMRCRWARSTHHLHVWKNLLEQAGFTLDDIPKQWEASGRSGAIRSSRRSARPWAATTSGASGSPCRSRDDTRNRVRAVHAGLRCQLRDPRRPAHHRRPRDPAQAHQGPGQLYGDRSQGLHPAGFGHLGQYRQQQAVPRSDRRHDVNVTLSIPNAPEERATGGLLQEHRDDRMAEWRRRPTAGHPHGLLCSCGVQGWRARSLPPRSSCASSSRMVGSRTSSTSPASACCRRCRSCSSSRSGSTRATRTAWLRSCSSSPVRAPTTIGGLGRSGDTPWSTGSASGRKAVHRVAAEGISPEQAVDEAIARIKEILAE